jgi:hypothetical protein
MKMFPINTGHHLDAHDLILQIPWALIEPHRAQAQRNHGQSLERLAERGGLGAEEAVAVIEDKDYYERWSPGERTGNAALKKHLDEFEKRTPGRALELNRQWRAMSDPDRDYVLGFFLGGLGCVGYGFTRPHADQAHARWALNQFEAALVAARANSQKPKCQPAVFGTMDGNCER